MTKIDKPGTILVNSTGVTNPNFIVPVGGTVRWQVDLSLVRESITIKGQDTPVGFQGTATADHMYVEHTYKTAGAYPYEIWHRQTDNTMGRWISGTIKVGR